MKIGDKVIIKSHLKIYKWYTTEIYTITEFSSDSKIARLNKDLPNVTTRNSIHINHLRSLKKERKKKLLKLNSL